MRIYSEICLSDFNFWSGAVDTAERITEADKWEELESILEDEYPYGLNETELNDLLWFEAETVLAWLDIEEEEEEEEEDSKDDF